MGVALLTEIDAYREIDNGEFLFLHLSDDKIPLSIFSIVSANNRLLPVSGSLLLQYLSNAMTDEPVPVI